MSLRPSLACWAVAHLAVIVLPVLGELQPEEVAILAVANDRESEAIARYYARKRNIPADHIITIAMPKGETLPREKWQSSVRPAIREWMQNNDPDQKIRCLVTTWNVPLRIGKAKTDPAMESYSNFLEWERESRLSMAEETLAAIRDLAGMPAAETTVEPLQELPAAGETEAENPNPIPPGPAAELTRLREQLQAALVAAQQKFRQGSASGRNQNAAQLQNLATRAAGQRVLAQGLQRQIDSGSELPPEAQTEFDALRGRLSALLEVQSLLERQAVGVQRDALVLALVERVGGLLGSIEWLDAHREIARKNESHASFDSELSLLFWPDGYQLLRWQPNYLRFDFQGSQLYKVRRTLMVARLEAPTLALTKGLIDTALRVESEGLQGKVYIDARGLGRLDRPNVRPGSYPDFDRSLLITAKGIQERTEMEVVLNESPQLFQPGECPQAALYCGWYSLAKYVDAFDWQPGAVAYHLASAEARTLRNPESQVWCKRMLDEGVCATMGPVAEPYLVAFPRPNEFFSLLLDGDRTLVECYYQTKPFNSWMMTLIGDPLYRPFKK